VLDKVNVLKIVQGLIDRGFNVRLPTEKIKPMAIPVGIEPSMDVKGRKVELGIKVGELAITGDMIWLGAHVSVDVKPARTATIGTPTPTPSPGSVLSWGAGGIRPLGRQGRSPEMAAWRSANSAPLPPG
jgi:hypothetical protein